MLCFLNRQLPFKNSKRENPMNREDDLFDLAPEMGQKDETPFDGADKLSSVDTGNHSPEYWPAKVDNAWQEQMVLQCAPLIKYIAGRMAIRLPSHISMDDLISSGIIGLIDAIHKFDPNKGIEFKTYAEFRIKGAILDELRSLDWIPRSVRKKQHTLKQAYAKLEKILGRPAEPEEIAEYLGIEMKEFHEMLDIVKPLSSLDIEESWRLSPDDKSDRTGTSDQNKGECPIQALDIFQRQGIVAQCIKELFYGMQLMLSLYYYEELTMSEIAFLAGCTESRVSQLITEVLREIGPEMATRFEISNYTSAISIDRHRQHHPRKSLLSLPKTLIWTPEKPGDDDPREKNAPHRWKNFARTISKKISSLHVEEKGEEKMKKSQTIPIPGITTFISYPTVLSLRELGISKTKDLLALTSDQFVQKCSGLKPRTIRAVAIKMMAKDDMRFADGSEATRNLMAYDPKNYKPFVATLAPGTPASAAGQDFAASASVASESPLHEQLGKTDAIPSTDPAPERSLRATLKRFSSAFDFMTLNEGNPDKFEGEETFTAENGHEYVLSISITRKKSPA